MASHVRMFHARSPAAETGTALRLSLTFYGIVYLVGVAVGVCLFLSLPPALRHGLQVQLQGAFAAPGTHAAGASGAGGIAAGYQDAAVTVGIVLVLWLVGQSPVGGGLAAIILFLRAASLGLGLTLVPTVYGWRGAGFDLLAVVPWNILAAGACIVAGAAAGVYARRVRRDRGEHYSVRLYAVYCGVQLLCAAAVLCGGWLESATAGRVAAFFALSPR